VGAPIRILAIGESSVSGLGLSRGDQTVAAVTARALAAATRRPIIWRTCGLSGATVREAVKRLLPRVTPEPADLLIIGFGVNDATAYRSPGGFADDLAALVTAARQRVGNAAVVIGGVAPLNSFPALPWALRIPKLVVERFPAPFGPELFASDGFHPNCEAHTLWGEHIAALALPLMR
jgi:lysophospholipase L1-like esterase